MGAHLIGLDWGSSSLRAMLIDAEGAALETRTSTAGASTLDGSPAAFSAALDALIGDWHALKLPLLACGMVGSQHGWREVPYATCPSDALTLAQGALSVDWRGQVLRLLPGLRCETPAGVPDVMRGEETQVLGALHLRPDLAARSCIVMPGTHSKWARVRDGAVQDFATHMSGELYALLRQHSVLGRLMPACEAGETGIGFDEGVKAARDQGAAGLPHQLFAVRTLGLTGRLPHEALSGYLSGLLIGHELRAGLVGPDQGAPLLLVGEPALCARYAAALALFERPAVPVFPNTAAAGLRGLAALI